MSSEDIENATDKINSESDKIKDTLQNENIVEFSKQVFLSFATVLILGILGTTAVFWMKHGSSLINLNIEDRSCFTNDKSDFTFIDKYFPYDQTVLPYNYPDKCSKRKDIAAATTNQNNDNLCGNPFNFLKGKMKTKVSMDKHVPFPYNFFPNIELLDKILENKDAKFTENFSALIKKTFAESILKSFTDSRAILNKFLKSMNRDYSSVPSFIFFILGKFIILLIVFSRFLISLFSPIIYIFKNIFVNSLYIYLFKLTSYILNKIKIIYYNIHSEKNKSYLNPIADVGRFKNFFRTLWIILYILVMIITIPIDAIVMLFLFLLCLAILLPAIGIVLLISIFSIFGQLFSLFSGAFESGKFVTLYSCNIHLLIVIFGAFIIYAASKNLDSTTTSFMGTSYGLYIIYQIFLFLKN